MAAVPDNESYCLRDDRDGICTLTLNRPASRNPLSLAMMQAVIHRLSEIAEDARTRVVIIAAEGPAFCAGHDLGEMRGASADELEVIFATCTEMMLGLNRLPQPVIARVQGIATAAGCQLVASCDLAVASESARFATPGVQIGLFCSTPMVALSRAVSQKHAMELLLTGDPVDAEAALAMGLVNRVVPSDALAAQTDSLAATIASRPTRVVRTGKPAFYQQIEMSREAAYKYAGRIMVENMLGDDAREGVSAFLDKRPPNWNDD